jgi:hypothetical protein
MANYHQIKNAAILTPTESTDLGSDANRYSNVFMSGNIMMSNGVTVTSTNVITPKIASVAYIGNDTAADIAGGQTLTITGSGFSAGASVLIGTTPSTVVTVVSSTSITFTSPVLSAGNYALYVINSDGGTAIYIPGIAYSGTPTWSTSSGNIASVYETNSISSTVAATGDATISYSVASGTLPTGSTLNSSTGLISGTAPASAGVTTYSFSIRATDGQNQDTDRSFTITVNTDAVTWASPADNTSTALDIGSAMSTVTLSASSAAGKSISYSANALPTGLSISTNTVVGTPTVVGSTTSLITATAADSGRTATRTLSWVVSVASEPYWPYVTLLLNGEGAAAINNAQNATFIDSSTNNYTITKSNTPTQGTNSPYSQASWSNYFDGTGDKLTLPSSSAFDLSSNTWTIEFWMYSLVTPDSGNACRILIAGSNGDAAAWNIDYFNNGGLGGIGWFRPFGSPGTEIAPAPAGTIALNTWYHIAVVCNAGSARIYVNGVSVSGPTSITLPSSASQTLRIGYDDVGTVNFQFKGYLSNVRIVKGTAVYTSIFTPSTTPLTAITNTVLLTCQNNRFIDNSTTNATITKSGDVTPQKFSPFNGTAVYAPATHGGSVYLKGANSVADQDFLTTTMTALGTGDFTIECWTYLESTGFINGGAVFGLFDNADNVQLILRPENDVYWRVFYKTTAFTIDQSTSPIVTNRWIHHAIVRISGTTRYYQNGILIGSGADTFDYGGKLKVGTYANYNMKGFISDFRVVAGTGVYTGSFTPPTQALTAISGTRVLLSFTNAGIIDQTGMNDLSLEGNTKIVTGTKKFGTGSMYFDGSGDYITIPKNPSMNFGTGAYTVECWFNIDANAGQQTIISFLEGIKITVVTTPGIRVWATMASSVYETASATITPGTWYHMAWVRESTALGKLYLDGTLILTVTSSVIVSYAMPTNQDVLIGLMGDGYSNPFKGYIDDLRLTRGYARYTGNFTAPTSTFNLK